MKILHWWQVRKQERERQARSTERMLSDKQRAQQPIPAETYLSQTRD